MESKKETNVSRRKFLRQSAITAGSAVLGGSLLSGLAHASAQKFKGKIAKRYEDSKEWWPSL